jgi:hypothetical protein
MAQPVEPRNRKSCPVRSCSQMLMMPSCDWSIQDHTRPAMTPEIRNGSRTMPRMTVDCVSRCITTAVSSEKNIPMATERPTK